METGKFYSVGEISKMLVGRDLSNRDDIAKYFKEPSGDKRLVSFEEALATITPFIVQIAVEYGLC